MAKGFKRGAGGGNPINFKIVGNPKPSNPKENTIWVDTDVEIPEWAFAEIDATLFGVVPLEGGIWIATGTSSNSLFDALKKNHILLMPLFVKQWIGGMWVNKTAKIYQYGAWHDLRQWTGQLYVPNENWSNITGGWVAETRNVGDGYTKFAPSITDNGTSITAAMNNNYAGVGFMVTANDIDLTGWNTLTVEISGYASNNDDNSGVALAVINRAVNDSGSCQVARATCGTNTFSKKTVTLNIASVSGKYAIGLHLYNGGTTRNQSATVYSMKLS